LYENFSGEFHFGFYLDSITSMMKFSQAISQVKWLGGEKTNILKTISVLVLRVLV